MSDILDEVRAEFNIIDDDIIKYTKLNHHDFENQRGEIEAGVCYALISGIKKNDRDIIVNIMTCVLVALILTLINVAR